MTLIAAESGVRIYSLAEAKQFASAQFRSALLQEISRNLLFRAQISADLSGSQRGYSTLLFYLDQLDSLSCNSWD